MKPPGDNPLGTQLNRIEELLVRVQSRVEALEEIASKRGNAGHPKEMRARVQGGKNG